MFTTYDLFRFGPLALLATITVAMPQNRFFPRPPAVNFNDPTTQFAGLAGLGVGVSTSVSLVEIILTFDLFLGLCCQ